MSTGTSELVATDESTVVTKSLFDAIVMEDGEGDPPTPMRAVGVRFSTRRTIFSINSSRPKQALGAWGGDSPKCAGNKTKIMDPFVVQIADLL